MNRTFLFSTSFPRVAITGAMWALICFCANAQGYTNVAPAQGLNFTVPVTSPADFGTGVSFRDFDGDGWDDLTFANVDDSLIVYRNNQGSLERMPSPAAAQGNTRTVLWVDIDNDGDDDLLVTTFNGPVKLYRNDGNWQFVDISASSGLLQADGKRWGASFGDYNKDGFLDLYVCTYIYSEESYAYSKLNHLYRNNGDGTFADVTLQAGVGDGMKASFQSVWMDVDLDGWPDLFVINDFQPSNSLYRNNGDGTFSEMAMALGMDQPGEHCMSISMCDFDLDGDLDIYITNTGVFPQTNNARHMLLLNNGDGTYTESSTLYGLDIFEWSWGALWVDHDNDGYQDLYIATHRELSPPVANLFFKNNGGTGFTNGNSLFPDPQITSSHSVARGDLDRDGYADIVVHNQHPFYPYLWKNDGGTASYVRITLEGTVSNKMAIGSWIRVHAGGKQYIHYTLCGENYLGQSSQHLLFGLGSASVVDSVVVEYLSGHVDRYYDLAVNAEYHFREGESLVPVISAPGGFAACAPATVVLDAGVHALYEWNTAWTGRYLPVSSSGAFWVSAGPAPGLMETSDTVQVSIGPAPAMVSTDTDPSCAGGDDGSIVLLNLSGALTESVVWQPAGSGMSLNGLSAGPYSYLYTDVNGCTAAGAVELFDPDPLFALLQITGSSNGTNGSLSWVLFGGTPPHAVTVNGLSVTGNEIHDLVPGVYTFVASDAKGCDFAEDVVVAGPVAVPEVAVAMGLRIRPNPVSTLLHAEWSGRLASWSITDATGRSVLSGASLGPQGSVEVSALKPGTYLLELFDSDGRAARGRFVKE